MLNLYSIKPISQIIIMLNQDFFELLGEGLTIVLGTVLYANKNIRYN